MSAKDNGDRHARRYCNDDQRGPLPAIGFVGRASPRPRFGYWTSARRFYERDGWRFDGARRTSTYGDVAVTEVRYRCALE
jgi:hypothetical protein